MTMEQTFAKRADGNPAFEAYYKVGPDFCTSFEIGRVLFTDP
jgi:glycine betaine/choline ABC-type transport system substrate-binding protein